MYDICIFVLTFIFRFTTDKKYFTGYQKIAAHHTQQIVVKIRWATALPPKKYIKTNQK